MLRLRVKDIDFSSNEVVVRPAKATRTVHDAPGAVKEPLSTHFRGSNDNTSDDLQTGLGRVALPNALERKYPNAGKEWGWQWVFPATSHYTDRSRERSAGTIFTNRFYRKR